jgi:DNA-binding MarR family transcriptional regulator
MLSGPCSAKGHLIRSPDPEDRRAILVSLADGCRETVIRAGAAHRAIKKETASRVPERDRIQIIQVLETLVEENCIEQRSDQS